MTSTLNRLSLSLRGYVAHVHDQSKTLRRRKPTPTMNTQMGSLFPTEKLDRNNFASWVYKMNQYLVKQGYWGYIDGAQAIKPNQIDKDYQI
mgnify:CR=1 FL=1